MTEAERYDKAWETGGYVPYIGLAYTQCLYRTRFFEGYKKILDVGCGAGLSVRYHREVGGIEAYGIDFAKSATDTWKKCEVDKYCSVASAEQIPFKDNEFDMVTCTEMLEHIPEESVKQVFSEMLRVGSKSFFFTVALSPAVHKMPHDGSEPHICLKPDVWWVEAMGRLGYIFTALPHVARWVLFIQARKHVPSNIIHRRY